MTTLHQSRDVIVITRAEKILHTSVLADMLFGDTISGTPTVAEVTATGLAFGAVSVNTGTLNVEGRSVAAYQACQFTVDARSVPIGSIGVATVRVTFQMTAGGGPRTFDVRLEIVV